MDLDSTATLNNKKPPNSTEEANNPIVEQSTTIAEQLQEYNSFSVALKMALLAIFTALGPVLSISFVYLPYFELMTFTIFLGGVVLGYLYGSILALLSTTLFEVIVSAIVGLGLPIYPFKLIAFLLVANAGAFFRHFLNDKTTFPWRILIASIGGILTLNYDVLTTMGLLFFLEMPIINYWILFLTGLPVTAIRIATNTMLFAFIPECYQRAIKPLISGKGQNEKSSNS